MTRDEAIKIDFNIAIKTRIWGRSTVEDALEASTSLIDSLIALGVLKVDDAKPEPTE